MTKYEELTRLCVTQVGTFSDMAQSCQLVAMQALNLLANDFEIPNDYIEHVNLDENLDPHEIAGDVRSCYPKLQPGQDGYWHCAFRMKFGGDKFLSVFGEITVMIGVHRRNGAFVLKCGNRKFDVREGDAESFRPFFDSLFDELKTGFLKSPQEGMTARFGF